VTEEQTSCLECAWLFLLFPGYIPQTERKKKKKKEKKQLITTRHTRIPPSQQSHPHELAIVIFIAIIKRPRD